MDALTAIRGHALRQVEAIVRTAPISVDTLETLRRVVADKFRVRVEVIESDGDVHRIAAEHADFSPYLHKQLVAEFLDGTTEGVTIEREAYDPFRCRYLAVVDDRDERKARVYFTIWHELSHLLLRPEQIPIPGFRRTPPVEERAKDPLENGAGYSSHLGTPAEVEDLLRFVAGQTDNTFYGPLVADVDSQGNPAHGRVCRTSCPDCSRDLSNLAYHNILDWRLGLDLARLALDPNAAIDFSVPAGRLWIQRQLGLTSRRCPAGSS